MALFRGVVATREQETSDILFLRQVRGKFTIFRRLRRLAQSQLFFFLIMLNVQIDTNTKSAIETRKIYQMTGYNFSLKGGERKYIEINFLTPISLEIFAFINDKHEDRVFIRENKITLRLVSQGAELWMFSFIET